MADALFKDGDVGKILLDMVALCKEVATALGGVAGSQVATTGSAAAQAGTVTVFGGAASIAKINTMAGSLETAIKNENIGMPKK